MRTRTSVDEDLLVEAQELTGTTERTCLLPQALRALASGRALGGSLDPEAQSRT